MSKRNRSQQYGTEDQFGGSDAFGGLGGGFSSSDSDLLGGSLNSTLNGTGSSSFSEITGEVETVTWGGQKYTPGEGGVEEARIDHHKDIRALIYSVLGGILGVFLSILIFSLFPEDTLAEGSGFANIVLIAMLSGLTALFSYLGIVLYSQTKAKGDVVKKGWLPIVALGLAGMLAAGGLLQFLYALEIDESKKQKHSGTDDYVFVLDDSTSMTSTDKNNERVSSMEDLLTSLDPRNRVGLVVFSDMITDVQNLVTIGDNPSAILEKWALSVQSNGLTYVGMALKEALAMDGVADPTRETQIIILTDGQSFDDPDSDTVEFCNNNNITVSMILLGSGNSAGSFEPVCNGTGGKIVSVQNSSELKDAYIAMRGPVIQQKIRDLIGSRPQETSWNPLLAILRIFGWTLIGVLYTVFLKVLLDKNAKFRYQEGISVTAGFVVGVAAEILGIVLPGLTVGRVAFAAVAIPLMCIVNSSYDTFYIKFQEAKVTSDRPIKHLGSSNGGFGGGKSTGTDAFGN